MSADIGKHPDHGSVHHAHVRLRLVVRRWHAGDFTYGSRCGAHALRVYKRANGGSRGEEPLLVGKHVPGKAADHSVMLGVQRTPIDVQPPLPERRECVGEVQTCCGGAGYGRDALRVGYQVGGRQ
ncbi:Uncharacterised protein [Mycobacteroides abscessus subsp. abscessus]|nr:Uncharacterised protein [Mycobacteroides abscessus subsp. abscessus]